MSILDNDLIDNIEKQFYLEYSLEYIYRAKRFFNNYIPGWKRRGTCLDNLEFRLLTNMNCVLETLSEPEYISGSCNCGAKTHQPICDMIYQRTEGKYHCVCQMRLLYLPTLYFFKPWIIRKFPDHYWEYCSGDIVSNSMFDFQTLREFGLFGNPDGKILHDNQSLSTLICQNKSLTTEEIIEVSRYYILDVRELSKNPNLSFRDIIKHRDVFDIGLNWDWNQIITRYINTELAGVSWATILEFYFQFLRLLRISNYSKVKNVFFPLEVIEIYHNETGLFYWHLMHLNPYFDRLTKAEKKAWILKFRDKPWSGLYLSTEYRTDPEMVNVFHLYLRDPIFTDSPEPGIRMSEENPYITIDHIRKFPIGSWDFHTLSANLSIPLIDKLENSDLPWAYDTITTRHYITAELYDRYPDLDYNYDILSKCINISIGFLEKWIHKPWNYKMMSLNIYLTWDILDRFYYLDFDLSEVLSNEMLYEKTKYIRERKRQHYALACKDMKLPDDVIRIIVEKAVELR